MQKTIQAIYEHGVFKPLEKVNLKEKTKAKILIDDDLLKRMSEKYFGAIKLNLTKKELVQLLHRIEETQ